jgi:adenine-specific DNA-methyltransferase
MLWDGKSRGTLMNVLRLNAQEKLAVVYVAPRQMFANIRAHGEFAGLLHELDSAAHHRLLEQATREGFGRMVEQGFALIR